MSLILFGNVIKRNWVNRGKVIVKGTLNKEAIKEAILKAVPAHEMRHHKHFNTVLRTMTRQCFPTQYPQLQCFLSSSLDDLLAMADQNP